jgi:hypothetical protein
VTPGSERIWAVEDVPDDWAPVAVLGAVPFVIDAFELFEVVLNQCEKSVDFGFRGS